MLSAIVCAQRRGQFSSSARMAASLRAITTSNPVSAESKPVSAIGRLKIRILKTGHLRFTGRNTGQSRWKQGNQPQRPCVGKLTHGNVTHSQIRLVFSTETRLPGWRRSADRTRLHANSLLTGNFTRNFAISRRQRPVWEQESAVPQRLLA